MLNPTNPFFSADDFSDLNKEQLLERLKLVSHNYEMAAKFLNEQGLFGEFIEVLRKEGRDERN